MRNLWALEMIVCGAILSCSLSSVRGDGVVENASKNAIKGAVKGVGQEISSGNLTMGAKQVTKGMVDGVADAVPLVTSQMANQANVNKKAIGNVARQVSADAVSGAVDATAQKLDKALGENGDGPLANTLTATTQRVTAAAARGFVQELRIEPAAAEKLSAAAVRGAMSEIHLDFRVWPIALAFVLGGVSTLFCGLGLMLLYILFQRKHVAVETPKAYPARPVLSV